MRFKNRVKFMGKAGFFDRCSGTLKKPGVAAAALAFSLAGTFPVMAASWNGFKTSMENFFKTGLGGPGLQGVGVAIACIGIFAAVLSFVVHKFNPQSRMPGWITCLLIGVIGAIAMSGIEKPLQLVTQFRDLIFGWFGL